MAIDYTSARGRVRLLITDIDEAQPIFSDEQVDAFLAMEDDDVRLAAAAAIETIARNEALVLKVIEVLDLKTDGAKVGAELRASAKALREAVENDGAFAIATMVDTKAGFVERIRKSYMRNS